MGEHAHLGEEECINFAVGAVAVHVVIQGHPEPPGEDGAGDIRARHGELLPALQEVILRCREGRLLRPADHAALGDDGCIERENVRDGDVFCCCYSSET